MAALFALLCALLGLAAIIAAAILVVVRARAIQLRLVSMTAAHRVLEADWLARQTAVIERLTTDIQGLGESMRALGAAIATLQATLMTIVALIREPQTGMLRALTAALPWLRGILADSR
jgi:hypothetical protein